MYDMVFLLRQALNFEIGLNLRREFVIGRLSSANLQMHGDIFSIR